MKLSSERAKVTGRVAFATSFLIGVAGCLPPARSAHENYLDSHSGWVGRDVWRHGHIDRAIVTKLQNGNLEYRIGRIMGRGLAPCTDVFEVDPVTRKVLKADFIGSEQSCVIPR